MGIPKNDPLFQEICIFKYIYISEEQLLYGSLRIKWQQFSLNVFTHLQKMF